jgi:hypothetical protein
MQWRFGCDFAIVDTRPNTTISFLTSGGKKDARETPLVFHRKFRMLHELHFYIYVYATRKIAIFCSAILSCLSMSYFRRMRIFEGKQDKGETKMLKVHSPSPAEPQKRMPSQPRIGRQKKKKNSRTVYYYYSE